MFRNCKKYKYIMFKNQFYQKIFRDEMKVFVKLIKENKPCKDVSKLTEHVSVTLAVNDSIKNGGEKLISDYRL